MREHGLHRPERSLQPGLHKHVHVRLGDVFERGHRPEGLRVGHQPVDAPEACHRLLDESEGAVPIGRVDRPGHRLLAEHGELAPDVVESLLFPARHGETHPSPCEIRHNGAPDAAAGRPGDDDHPAGEVVVRAPRGSLTYTAVTSAVVAPSTTISPEA